MPAANGAAAALRETPFDNRRLARLGLEVMTLKALRRRVPPATLARPERVDFFMLMLVERGRGVHSVDFARQPLREGSLVFVRPGQVQQWHARDGLEGLMVLVHPAVMNPDTTRSALQHSLAAEWSSWPGIAVLAAAARPAICRLMRELADECRHFDASELGIALMRSMLACLLLRVARAYAGAAPRGADPRAGAPALVRLLQGAVEARLRSRPTVQALAADLGYSVSTLNRACLAAAGASAKQVVDRRVALEAQRLLVHSRDPAAHVGMALGFSEPTNFLKFFKRIVGVTPDTFRRRHAADPA